MKVLSGKKTTVISKCELQNRIRGFSSVNVDIGTGSGRFVLKNALNDPQRYWIGVDPVSAQMAENAVKAQKRRMGNISFTISSVEDLPSELIEIADAVTVILPWGSLRDGIAKAEPTTLNGLRLIGKPGSPLTMWIGYDEQREAAEMARRSLPRLSETYLTGLSDAYSMAGINLQNVSSVSNTELCALESDWARRLAYGAPRQVFKMSAKMV